MDVPYIYHNTPFYVDTTNHVAWTSEENKIFENMLAMLNHGSEDFFQRLAFTVPGKTIQQIKEHYEALVEDIKNIELGHVPIPDYKNDNHDESIGQSDKKNKKSVKRWSEEEHRNFLVGQELYGKGDWRAISRNCVPTKTTTQIASHAQKYFLRLEKLKNPTH